MHSINVEVLYSDHGDQPVWKPEDLKELPKENKHSTVGTNYLPINVRITDITYDAMKKELAKFIDTGYTEDEEWNIYEWFSNKYNKLQPLRQDY